MFENHLDRYAPELDDRIVSTGQEGVSRGLAERYQRGGNPRYRTMARDKLEAAEKILKAGRDKGKTFEEFELRIPRARLRLAKCNVIDLTLEEQTHLAKQVRNRAWNMGDERITREMDEFLRSVKTAA